MAVGVALAVAVTVVAVLAVVVISAVKHGMNGTIRSPWEDPPGGSPTQGGGEGEGGGRED